MYQDKRCVVSLIYIASFPDKRLGTGTYTVAKDDVNLKELLFEFVSPPPTLVAAKLASSSAANNTPTAPTNTSDLMQMGFPTLIHSTQPGLCSCHSKLKTVGFVCPRCSSQICDVPTECRVCGLTVVSSPHLARSYRHLFPVRLSSRYAFSDDSLTRCSNRRPISIKFRFRQFLAFLTLILS